MIHKNLKKNVNAYLEVLNPSWKSSSSSTDESPPSWSILRAPVESKTLSTVLMGQGRTVYQAIYVVHKTNKIV